MSTIRIVIPTADRVDPRTMAELMHAMAMVDSAAQALFLAETNDAPNKALNADWLNARNPRRLNYVDGLYEVRHVSKNSPLDMFFVLSQKKLDELRCRYAHIIEPKLMNFRAACRENAADWLASKSDQELIEGILKVLHKLVLGTVFKGIAQAFFEVEVEDGWDIAVGIFWELGGEAVARRLLDELVPRIMKPLRRALPVVDDDQPQSNPPD